MPTSVFSKYLSQNYPYRYAVTLHVDMIAGGIPADPHVAEGWLKKNLGWTNETLIANAVAETMVERGVGTDEAVTLVNSNKHLNGFKRDKDNGDALYIEGRQVKAMLKESSNVAANENRIGSTGWGSASNKNYLKGIKAWFPEHVFVIEDRIPLGDPPRTEPSVIEQRFVHTRNGAGIQYEEIVHDAELSFTVETDHNFKPEEWAAIWLTGERGGLGATRSQGFGRFTVVRFDKLEVPGK